MKYGVFIYEGGLILLILAMVYMAAALFKLTKVVNEKQNIWFLPVFAALVLFVALLSHAYANFVLLPNLNANIALMAQQAASAQKNGTDLVSVVIGSIQSNLLYLKAFSFTCFFIASIALTAATAIYMKWISK